MKRLVLYSLLLGFSWSAAAQADDIPRSPYAGEETRSLKSLSPEDIAELRRGGGWGLAKVAELNGMPGPVHLLELHHEIPLSAEQVSELTAVFEGMRAAAIAEGERLIQRERVLEEAFRDRTVEKENLGKMLAEIEEARTALRNIHLTAHLGTPALLSDAQIVRYNALRGYGSDPCAHVPQGHDPRMWRMHNGCE